jgi:hypothetical protein
LVARGASQFGRSNFGFAHRNGQDANTGATRQKGLHPDRRAASCAAARWRLIAEREGKRVRLFTRNGHDWSGRYPLIVEAALRNRNSAFVIDGEAVLLGVDGRSDFNGFIPASTMPKSSSTLSTCWSATARTSASCP